MDSKAAAMRAEFKNHDGRACQENAGAIRLMKGRWTMANMPSTMVMATTLVAAVGCCSSYSVTVVDLITELPIEGVVATVNPDTLPGLLSGKLDTLSDAYTDASGNVDVKAFCNSFHHANFVHWETGRSITLDSFTPQVEIRLPSHWSAMKRAVEDWINARSMGAKSRTVVVLLPSIGSPPPRILAAGDFSRMDDPQQALIVSIDGDRADDGALDEIKQFPNVRFLRIGKNTRITNEGLVRLAAYPNLMSIDLWPGPNMTNAGIEQLRRVLPNTVIVVHDRTMKE